MAKQPPKKTGRPRGPAKTMVSASVLDAVSLEVDAAATEKGLSRNAFLCAMLERWAKRRGVDLDDWCRDCGKPRLPMCDCVDA